MMKLGFMLWRIGETVDFWTQLDWVRQHQYDEVSFWTHPGSPGVWQGFDPWLASPDDLRRLKEALQGFKVVDLHGNAGLQWELEKRLCSTDEATRRTGVQKLRELVDFAAGIRADVITIHGGDAAGMAWDIWQKTLGQSLAEIDPVARAAGVRIGVEMLAEPGADTSAYNLVRNPQLTNVGLTMDTGHMMFRDGAGFRPFGTLGRLMRRLGQKLFHVHVHDYDGQHDHVAIGAGKIDFPELVAALVETGYSGSLCLELNADRVSPEAMLASRDRLRAMVRG